MLIYAIKRNALPQHSIHTDSDAVKWALVNSNNVLAKISFIGQGIYIQDSLPTLIDDETIAKSLILSKYCADETPHSTLLITYAELLAYVWVRIQRSEHKEIMITILEQEIKDSAGFCYIGRFNRTLNAPVGFYEDISVRISDADRISAIVYRIRETEPIENQLSKVTQALQEAGYDEKTILEWTIDL